jgi:hypothetical protein
MATKGRVGTRNAELDLFCQRGHRLGRGDMVVVIAFPTLRLGGYCLEACCETPEEIESDLAIAKDELKGDVDVAGTMQEVRAAYEKATGKAMPPSRGRA